MAEPLLLGTLKVVARFSLELLEGGSALGVCERTDPLDFLRRLLFYRSVLSCATLRGCRAGGQQYGEN
jgi:hypothetical protein